MTYLDLIRDADRQLDDGQITLGEYEQMIEPLKREIQPEIIRCKDCRYHKEYEYVNGKPKYLPKCGFHQIYAGDDAFCNHAERRTECN